MTFKCWERNVCAEQKLASCSLFRFRFSSLFNHYFIVLPLFLPRSWHVQNSWKYFSYVLLVVDVTNIVAQNWLFLCFKKCNYSNSNNNNSNNNSNNNNNNNNNDNNNADDDNSNNNNNNNNHNNQENFHK